MSRRDPYRRAARRARRAFRRGDNAYPVMVFGPEEPLGLIALAAIGRWAYRHRSAFFPFITAVAVFIASAWLHHRHSEWWITITALTVGVSVPLAVPHRALRPYRAGRVIADTLARVWRACGLDRQIERAYAAIVVAVSGGWAATATAVGPTVKPLPAVAVFATLILGIPWWIHRRRRARVRVERTISAWPDVADNMGLSGSHIASVMVDAWGWTARVILRKGTPATIAPDKIPSIESGLGLRPGSVRIFPDNAHADRFILRVIQTDPHAQPIPWPANVPGSITRPVEIGLFEDGQPARVMILRRNVLIGGIMGSGESGILNIILAFLVACADAVIWGVDLKGGMELSPWADCLDRLATTPHEANELFKDAIAELNRRAHAQAAQGSRLWNPTPTQPALVIIVDEYAEMPDEARDYADSVARRGRAVAVNLIAATQRPTQQSMGNNTVRSQMDVRICLRVRERRDVDLILGQGSFTSGWRAHTLNQPGEFLISDPEHSTPDRARAYLITDDQVGRHAHNSGHDWPTLPRPDTPPEATTAPHKAEPARGGSQGHPDPETALWAQLRAAPPEGVPIGVLVRATGKGRTWVYERLRDYATAGRVIQTARGHWRATDADDPPSGPTAAR